MARGCMPVTVIHTTSANRLVAGEIWGSFKGRLEQGTGRAGGRRGQKGEVVATHIDILSMPSHHKPVPSGLLGYAKKKKSWRSNGDLMTYREVSKNVFLFTSSIVWSLSTLHPHQHAAYALSALLQAVGWQGIGLCPETTVHRYSRYGDMPVDMMLKSKQGVLKNQS